MKTSTDYGAWHMVACYCQFSNKFKISIHSLTTFTRWQKHGEHLRLRGFFCKLVLEHTILLWVTFICFSLCSASWVKDYDLGRRDLPHFTPLPSLSRSITTGSTRMVPNWINHFAYASSVRCAVSTYIIQKIKKWRKINAWNISQLSHVEHRENCLRWRRRAPHFEKLGLGQVVSPIHDFRGKTMHTVKACFFWQQRI